MASTTPPKGLRVQAAGLLKPSTPDGWRLAVLCFAALTTVPLLVVLGSLAAPAEDVWDHLLHYVLPNLLVNTVWLVFGVGLLTAILGVGLAWLTAVCEFPGRRLFSWALLLPLAIPAYVTGFVSIGLLEYTGPLQTWLRTVLGTQLGWFPPIRSTGGVIVVMSLALYPYVYLLTRNAFLTQGKRALEAAQTLGHGPWGGFFRVALPMARPWIAGGVALVLMETLADFGTVAAFNYDTFTTAIYKTWFSLFSLTAASQLASLLIMLAFVLLLIEQLSRQRMRFTPSGKTGQGHKPIVLTGGRAWLASGAAGLVLTAAFIVPLGQLLIWCQDILVADLDSRYLGYLLRSLLLGAMAALLVTFSALIISYANRRHSDLWMRGYVRLATLGYAVPGSVLAVGVFAPIAWLDNQIIASAKQWFDVEIGTLLQGTLLVMLASLLVRFMAVGYNSVDSAMQRVTRSVDEASLSLGVGAFGLLRRVHLPMLRGGLMTAAILVFVDVMKEMPITLMTRPFGWDTLSVRIFELTSEGQWERAALPAVALVLIGLVPIILLIRHSETP